MERKTRKLSDEVLTELFAEEPLLSIHPLRVERRGLESGSAPNLVKFRRYQCFIELERNNKECEEATAFSFSKLQWHCLLNQVPKL